MSHVPRIAFNDGNSIPQIGFGVFKIPAEDAEQLVGQAIDVGYRHIDTAWGYFNEEGVGSAVRNCGLPREDLFVTTKVWNSAQGRELSTESFERSLETLGFEYLDLLLIHWPSIDALCKVKRAGLAKAIGVSNFTVAMLDEAAGLTTEPLSMLQAEYHPRLDQSKLRAAAARHGMLWTSYCPIGKGNVFDDPVVTGLAAKYGRSPSQIVLRWQVQQPGTVAIPKSVTPSRIRENIAVFDFALTDAEMAALSGLTRSDGRIVSPAFAPAWDS